MGAMSCLFPHRQYGSGEHPTQGFCARPPGPPYGSLPVFLQPPNTSLSIHDSPLLGSQQGYGGPFRTVSDDPPGADGPSNLPHLCLPGIRGLTETGVGAIVCIPRWFVPIEILAHSGSTRGPHSVEDRPSHTGTADRSQLSDKRRQLLGRVSRTH